MSRLLRFDGRVAVVTGAGNGLGKEYAYLFAQRGASVVVNDLGGDYLGKGSSTNAADEVVSSITSNGGKAVANYDSVVEGEKIVQTALERFGRIDILVNNAGIIRDKTLSKMNENDWNLVNEIHLDGTFKTSRAAWGFFKSQNYGRIVNVSSPVGLFGNFGQANYAAAKSAILGFSATLAKEGERFNINSNCLVPLAKSRMSEMFFPPDIIDPFAPNLVAPIVAWLCHEDCADSGMVIESAGGYARRYQWATSQGSLLRSSKSEDVTLETVKDKWDKIIDMKNSQTSLSDIHEMIGQYIQFLNQMEDNNKKK